jgi:hypothetical protein
MICYNIILTGYHNNPIIIMITILIIAIIIINARVDDFSIDISISD